MKKVKVKLNGQDKSISSGVVRAKAIYGDLSVDPSREVLSLVTSEALEVSLLPEDSLIVRGKERFSSANIVSDTETTVLFKTPITIALNDGKIKVEIKQPKIKSSELYRHDKELENACLYTRLEEGLDIRIDKDQIIVLQDSDVFFTVPVSDDGAVDIAACTEYERRIPQGEHLYQISIERAIYKVDKQKLTGKEILGLAGKKYNEWSLNQALKGGRRVPIESEQLVDISKPGIERFETVKRQAQQGIDVN